MIKRFNIFLKKIRDDGTYDEVRNRWLLETSDIDVPMPNIPLSGKNGILQVATDCGTPPYSFRGESGTLKGFCVEIATRFAAHEDMGIKITDIEFNGLIPYIASGKADIAVTDMVITDERKESILFTDPIGEERLGILALKSIAGVSAKERVGIIEWLKTGIDRNLITDNRWKMIVSGLGVTMLIAVSAQFFGTLFGFFVCYLLTHKNRFIRWLGNVYCGLINGTPMVVLLMITYYIIFGSTNISNVLVAIVAFTMLMGAIIAQILKGAIDTVDHVEIEAARSIGFSAFGAFMSVTFPQAVRRAMPAYTNGFVELVKATAIVGFIAIQDLTRAGDIIRSRTYDAYFPLLFVALIYLIVTTICVQVFKLIVNKINGGETP
jgi:polar amino acid transport system substrate-binding protein